MAISLQQILLRSIDIFFEKWPRPFPGKERLRQCKIISHRGEHDNQSVMENTIEAFEQVRKAGVWGVEFDIRWTRDLHPVVFHDPDTVRMFGVDRKIRDLTLAELSAAFPLIPTLSEVVDRYGKTLHLMVEIKAEHYPDPVYQNRVLETIFLRLTPKEDYHLLSLTPAMFRPIDFVPATTFIPIAETNIRALSRLALSEHYSGLSGHYLLLTDNMMRKHHRKNQPVGTGFVPSKNALFREVNRGVEWIFSNNAARLQRYVDREMG